MVKPTRISFLLFALFTIGLGLLSRTKITPDFIYPYIGDALYATMIYFFVGFLMPQKQPQKIALFAVLICFCIEASQLIDVVWLNNLRTNRYAKLVLGQGFLWSDLLAYIFGAAFGWGIQKIGFKKK